MNHHRILIILIRYPMLIVNVWDRIPSMRTPTFVHHGVRDCRCPWILLVSLWGAHRMCHTLCKCRRVQGWWYWRLRHKKHTFRCCNSLRDFFSLLKPNWTFSSVSIVMWLMMKGIPPICPPSILYCFHTCHLWHRCSHVIGCLWLCESCTGVTLEGSRSIFPTSLERSSEIPSREIESSGSSSLLKWIDDRGMSWNVAEKFSRQ